MLIYLRHGDDRGDDTYPHDRPLNDRGKRRAAKRAKHLIKEYGHPHRVYISPFRRARETLAAMTPRFSQAVEVHPDPRIAQYLSKKQQRAPRLHPETLAAITPHEDEEAFQRRISSHVEDARIWADTLTIWCITHQIVIEAVERHFEVRAPRKLDFLEYLLALK